MIIFIIKKWNKLSITRIYFLIIKTLNRNSSFTYFKSNHPTVNVVTYCNLLDADAEQKHIGEFEQFFGNILRPIARQAVSVTG